MAEELTYLKRTGVGAAGGDGPPKFTPFGQKLVKNKELANVKANPVQARKEEVEGDEDKKENEEFASQRKDAIQEAAKGEQKKFGGGSKPITDSRAKRSQEKERSE